ncbi:MAG: hypothetical protein WDN25_13415 [Acetobacteraceae bacterium]
MKISETLNLVVPIDQPDGTTIYVHSTPLSREVFETYYLVIAKTFSAIYGEGLSDIAGPRIAAMLLRDVAVRSGLWEGPNGAERGLMAEIRRLSNVVMPGPNGWQTIPYQDAVDRKMIDSQDVGEVENALVFFTVASAMHRRPTLAEMLPGAVKLWGAQTSSSSCMAFAGSLSTSSGTASSGANQVASSVPS